MLKRDVREMVSYLVGERKSFKVTFANGKIEVVEYRGYCWVLGNKGYTDKELVEKMVRFQNNVSKFIIRLEVIEEEVEEVAVEEETSVEESLVEEVENLTDDLFQDEDLAYCEEGIERETNNIKRERIMAKLKEMKNVKINNYVDFSSWELTEKEVREYIGNLTLNDIKLYDYNTFRFTKYNEDVEVFIYYNGFVDLVCNIVDIY